jgi:hypothetical protein
MNTATQVRTAAIRIEAKAASPEALDAALRLTEFDLPCELPPGSVVIEVRSAGVNPSDVKAVLGNMPHAVWPRTSGRDYAGVVVEGPRNLLGKEVWGSGGELGIRRDGTHTRHLVLPAAAVREKPANISLREAGAVGVPFITAYEGLREAGSVHRGDIVLVPGANGKVGQAVIQLATAAGGRVFGVERTPVPYRGHASSEVTMFAASESDVAERVRDATGGHGADIVFIPLAARILRLPPAPWQFGRSLSPRSSVPFRSTSSLFTAAAIISSASAPALSWRPSGSPASGSNSKQPDGTAHSTDALSAPLPVDCNRAVRFWSFVGSVGCLLINEHGRDEHQC